MITDNLSANSMFDKNATPTGARAGSSRVGSRYEVEVVEGAQVGNQNHRHHLCLKLPCQKHQGGVREW